MSIGTLEQQLPSIITSLSSTYGDAFFNELTLQLNKYIGADYTFITRLNANAYTSKTISLVAKGKLIDNFEYSLANTPCADVSDDSLCIYPSNICHFYPNDQLLIDMKIEGYIGTPLYDSQGEIMGLMVALHEKEITNPDLVVTIFELFSGRVSAEIERTERESELKNLTKSLEDKVIERTASLTTALKQLEITQQEIIAKEKMASLGSLVAGIAHEINSPLGIAILGASVAEETTHELNEKLISNTLSKDNLTSSISTILTSLESMNFNLHRAANLVHSFKQVAVDRSTDDIREFSLSTWLNELTDSLMPMLKKNSIMVKLALPESPVLITTCASKLSQVVSNLITNASIHAFPESIEHENKLLTIKVNELDGKVNIAVIDNGIGIKEENMDFLFDPFFTTNRSKGSTGLGLSIIRNMMTGCLQGSINVNNQIKQGSEFKLVLPKVMNTESIS